VLLSPNASVPPLWLDGLTTLVIAALKAAEFDAPLPPLPLLLPPPQAARASAASPPNTVSQMLLRLFKRTASRRVLVAGRTGSYPLAIPQIECVAQPVSEQF
jgi:hypothetical protein